MSSSGIRNTSTQWNCDCYKRLQAYGIPLNINDENDLYTESPRKIEYENAFKLPGYLKINESITEYLYVQDNELHNVFFHMAEVIPNLTDFDVNLLNFWILDVFIEGLWIAQNAKMKFEHQKATLLWIAYCFNYIQKENPSRSEFFSHLKAVIFHIGCYKGSTDSDERSGEFIKDPKDVSTSESQFEGEATKKNKTWSLPLPPPLENEENTTVYDTKTPSTSEENNSVVNETEDEKSIDSDSNQRFPENDTETNVENMKIIMEIIYRIFGRVWVFLEIQSIFHAMPPVTEVDLPFELPTPKPVLKLDSSTYLKSDRTGRRPTISEKSFEETESEKQLHKNDYILPLQVAEESKLIFKQPCHSSQMSVVSRKKT